MVVVPDPSRCVAMVSDHSFRVTHFRQCDHKPKVDVGGYQLCAMHAKRARLSGSLQIVTGRKGNWGDVESKTVPVAPDVDAQEARRERERIEERDRRSKSWGYQAEKTVKIAAYLRELLLPELFDDLFDAHPDDVAALIEQRKAKVGAD